MGKMYVKCRQKAETVNFNQKIVYLTLFELTFLQISNGKSKKFNICSNSNSLLGWHLMFSSILTSMSCHQSSLSKVSSKQGTIHATVKHLRARETAWECILCLKEKNCYQRLILRPFVVSTHLTKPSSSIVWSRKIFKTSTQLLEHGFRTFQNVKNWSSTLTSSKNFQLSQLMFKHIFVEKWEEMFWFLRISCRINRAGSSIRIIELPQRS